MSPWRIEGLGLPEPIEGYEGQIYRGTTAEGERITVVGTQEGFDIIGDAEGDTTYGGVTREYRAQSEKMTGRTIPLGTGQYLTAYYLDESTLPENL